MDIYVFIFVVSISLAGVNSNLARDCGESLEWDPVEKTCRPCLQGSVYNKYTKRCQVSGAAKECSRGFQYDFVEEKCVDIDECNGNKFPCGKNEKCVNEDGGYKCKRNRFCGQGYKFNTTIDDCEDENECETMTNVCGSKMICENVPGSFTCRSPCPKNKIFYWGGGCHPCQEGFRLNRTTNRCQDMDECEGPHRLMCSPYRERCVRMPGLSRCETFCSGGTVMVKGVCFDVDECAAKTHTCKQDQRCVNLFGTFQCQDCNANEVVDPDSNTCVCKAGFHTDDYTGECTDKDECAVIPSPCGPHGRCVNHHGNYSCVCPEGYVTANGTCQDVDECTSFAGVCGSRSCENLPGSFRCACPSGFRSNPYGICEDIDECAESPGVCSSNNLLFGERYQCFNLVGSFRCLRSHCPNEYRTVVNLGDLRCELFNSNCSLENNKECLQTLPEKIFFHVVQIPRISEVPHKVGEIPLEMPQFGDFHMKVVIRKAIDSVTKERIEVQNAIMMTSEENERRASLYLTKTLTRPSEIVCEVSLKSRLQGRQKILARHQYHIFSDGETL